MPTIRNRTSKRFGLLRTSGDHGNTDLIDGQAISKASLQMDILGDIDELSSVLGLARNTSKKKNVQDDILDIQNLLVKLMGIIASPLKNWTFIHRKDLLELIENKAQKLNDQLKIPNGFVLSGHDLSAGFLHQARTITRRAERKIVNLYQNKKLTDNSFVSFFNRLSVYLFLLSYLQDPKQTLAQK